jgi:general stress protein 26
MSLLTMLIAFSKYRFLLTDNESKELIWEEGDTMYYKEGVTDPDYCVLRFTTTSGRYYSSFKSENFAVE